jgi:hypothetical protein
VTIAVHQMKPTDSHTKSDREKFMKCSCVCILCALFMGGSMYFSDRIGKGEEAIIDLLLRLYSCIRVRSILVCHYYDYDQMHN